MDKTTLLNMIQTEYAHFESLVAPLSETQLCTPTFAGEWSIKDIMAHIAVWEQLCTRWLEEFLRGGPHSHQKGLTTSPMNGFIERTEIAPWQRCRGYFIMLISNSSAR